MSDSAMGYDPGCRRGHHQQCPDAEQQRRAAGEAHHHRRSGRDPGARKPAPQNELLCRSACAGRKAARPLPYRERRYPEALPGRRAAAQPCPVGLLAPGLSLASASFPSCQRTVACSGRLTGYSGSLRSGFTPLSLLPRGMPFGIPEHREGWPENCCRAEGIRPRPTCQRSRRITNHRINRIHHGASEADRQHGASTAVTCG